MPRKKTLPPTSEQVVEKLLQMQQEIRDRGLLTGEKSAILSIATGTGKTYLAQESVQQVLQAGEQRVIYICPLKAISTEVQEAWAKRLHPPIVGVYNSDVATAGDAIPYEQATVWVMTLEHLDLMLRRWRKYAHLLLSVRLLIVDELHLLGDGNRGARLEGTINRFRRINPFLKILGLSATLGNLEELAAWLDAESYSSKWRPVPLRWERSCFRNFREAFAKTVTAVKARAGRKILVFANSRRQVEVLAQQLDKAGISADRHHAGLTPSERKQIEARFRCTDPHNPDAIDVLVATSTVEMGVNTPSQTVIMCGTSQYTGNPYEPWVPLSTTQAWQRAGRCGRWIAGGEIDAEGEVLLFSHRSCEQSRYYDRGRFEPILSQMGEASLAEQIVVEVACGLSRTIPQLQRAFSSTLAAQQGRLLPVPKIVSQMLEALMLQESEPYGLIATPLGKVATRHLLMPASVTHLVSGLRAFPSLSLFDLLLLVLSCGEVDVSLYADFYALDSLQQVVDGIDSVLLYEFINGQAKTVQKLLGKKGKPFLNMILMAAALWGWTQVGQVEPVAVRLKQFPFDLEKYPC